MTEEMLTRLAIAGAAAGGLLLLVFLWLALSLRGLDRSWRRMQERRRELDAALKERGNLIPHLVEITRHRLTTERDTLEGLAHLRSKSIGGRTPREKARAEAELDGALGRILRAAANDPGLSGLSEFEGLCQSLEAAANAIADAARAYNDAAQDYNRRAAGFPGRFLAGLTGSRAAEYFGNPAAPRSPAMATTLPEPEESPAHSA